MKKQSVRITLTAETASRLLVMIPEMEYIEAFGSTTIAFTELRRKLEKILGRAPGAARNNIPD